MPVYVFLADYVYVITLLQAHPFRKSFILNLLILSPLSSEPNHVRNYFIQYDTYIIKMIGMSMTYHDIKWVIKITWQVI